MCSTFKHGQQVWAWHSEDKYWQLAFVLEAKKIERTHVHGNEYVFFLPNNSIHLVKNTFVEEFGTTFKDRYLGMLEKHQNDTRKYDTSLTTLNLYIQLKMERLNLDVHKFKAENRAMLLENGQYWIEAMLKPQMDYTKPTCVTEEFVNKKLPFAKNIPGRPAIVDKKPKTDQPSSSTKSQLSPTVSTAPDPKLTIKTKQFVWFKSKLSGRYVPAVVLHTEPNTNHVFVAVLLAEKTVEYGLSGFVEDFCANFKKRFDDVSKDLELVTAVHETIKEICCQSEIKFRLPHPWQNWARNAMHKYSNTAMRDSLFEQLYGKLLKQLNNKIDRSKKPKIEPKKEKIEPISEPTVACARTEQKPPTTVAYAKPEHEEPPPEDPSTSGTQKRKQPPAESSAKKAKIDDGTPKTVRVRSTKDISQLIVPLEKGFTRQIVYRNLDSSSSSVKKGDVYYRPPSYIQTMISKLRSKPDVYKFLSAYSNAYPELAGLVAQNHFNFNANIETKHENETYETAGKPGKRSLG